MFSRAKEFAKLGEVRPAYPRSGKLVVNNGENIEKITEQLSGLNWIEITEKLGDFDNYDRSIALPFVLSRSPGPADTARVYLQWGNVCDAPWAGRRVIADRLRDALREVGLRDLLGSDARAFYDSLPALIAVYRGCEKGRERGLHWTTDRAVAERFASGQRCFNRFPTLVRAVIPKQHVFAVFADREEIEVVVDPKRLRKIFATSLDLQNVKRIRATKTAQ
jgi:hypothetical protein